MRIRSLCRPAVGTAYCVRRTEPRSRHNYKSLIVRLQVVDLRLVRSSCRDMVSRTWSSEEKVMHDPARVQLSGPLAMYAKGFAEMLVGRGYLPSTVAWHLRLMAYVSRWLQAEGLAVAELDAAAVDAVVAQRRGAGSRARVAGAALP